MESTDIIIANLGYPETAGRTDKPAEPVTCRAGDFRGPVEGLSGGCNGGGETDGRLKELRVARLLRQQEAGVDWVPVADSAPRERVLEHAAAFGLAPASSASFARESKEDGGRPAAPDCRIQTWYGTACRYAVPEFAANAAPRLVRNPWAEAFREARAPLKSLPVPVMIGPYTFAKLAGGLPAGEALERLAPVYAAALRELEEAGAEWVQLEEPELARPVPPDHWPLIMRTSRVMHDAAPRLRLMLQPTFGVPDDFGRLLELPVSGIGLDFTADGGRALREVAKRGFPSDLTLGAGIIDGRSVWRADLTAACSLLERLRKLAPKVRLALQPTCSLVHAPAALPEGRAPYGLPPHALATADVKLGELRVLRAALIEGREAVKLDLSDSDVTQDILRVLLSARPGTPSRDFAGAAHA